MRQWIGLVRMSRNPPPGVAFPPPSREVNSRSACRRHRRSARTVNAPRILRRPESESLFAERQRARPRRGTFSASLDALRPTIRRSLAFERRETTVKVIDSHCGLRLRSYSVLLFPVRVAFNKFSRLRRKMKVGLLKSFLHYFNLKQGTVLIAVFQLFTSGFCMIFFVLALAHAMGIQEMVVRDTEDALEREALEDISSNHLNTKKMDMAHHNATETVYSMYCGLVITVIHFTSTILLLYGALTNNRHFMAPWMMVMMTIISALTISLFLVQRDCPFIATLGGKADICERMIVLFLVITSSYVWFVVYSTYKSLETKKGLTHILHGVKKKPVVVPVVQKTKIIHAQSNKPFEV